MAEYIDKSALVAEIEKLIDEIYASRPFDSLSREQQTALWYVKSIMSSIDILEVKEVDLKKEMDKEWNKCKPIDEGMGLEIASIEHEQFDNIAKHFFELGLKMQENQNLDGIKREWYNKGYFKGRKEAHIPARELGLPKVFDFKPLDADLERDAVSFCFDNGLNTTPHIAKTIANHFFELGMAVSNKAQKGK